MKLYPYPLLKPSDAIPSRIPSPPLNNSSSENGMKGEHQEPPEYFIDINDVKIENFNP